MSHQQQLNHSLLVLIRITILIHDFNGISIAVGSGLSRWVFKNLSFKGFLF